MLDILFNTPFATSVGIVGFGLYVLSYAMLTLRIINSNCILFFSLNFAAAVFVLYSLTINFNLASALIQLFWISISAIGIALRLSNPNTMAR